MSWRCATDDTERVYGMQPLLSVFRVTVLILLTVSIEVLVTAAGWFCLSGATYPTTLTASAQNILRQRERGAPPYRCLECCARLLFCSGLTAA
jgi:hypothetical protein